MPDDPAREDAFAKNTRATYAEDWVHFTRWCRLKGTDPLAPSSELIGRCLTELASSETSRGLSSNTIERRLSGLAWNYAQRGVSFDRKNRDLVELLSGIKRRNTPCPCGKKRFGPRTLSR
ncbi:hypothetical protein [Thioclava sp.]|uniref:hypothetical protein n=1 Tax=Thioclava sp. TaxID=1933450 RepID=UPI003AA964E2